MLKKIGEIKNCKDQSMHKLGNHLIYVVGEVTYINNKSLDAFIPVSRFSSFNDRLYFTNDSKLFEVSQNKPIELFSFEDADLLKIVNADMLLLHKRVSRKELKYSFYDFNYNLLWSKTDNEFAEIINDVVLCIERFNKTQFDIRNIKTGAVLWKFNSKEEFNIEGSFIVFKDILVVAQAQLSNSKKEIVLTGHNLHSGKKLWELSSYSEYYVLNKENGCLYAFASNIFGDNFLVEVNLIKGILNKSVFENFKGNIKPHLNTIHRGRLYFANNKIGCGIGMIDLNKKEVIAENELGFREGVQIGKPEIFDKQIYVVDSENTLHILEEENTELA